MALALDTGHALYADIVACICVDDDNTVKDLKGDTCTPHANVVIGSGTYGRHFRTLLNGSNAEGVALTNGHLVKPVSTPVGTTVVVINAGNSRTSRGCVTNGPTTSAPGPACYTGDVPAGHAGGTANPSTLGTTDIIGTGAHMIAVGWNGTSAHFVYCDGAMEANPSANLGNASNSYKAMYIGGTPTGGYGGLAADYVWYVHFRKYLSEAELDDLYASLGAGNAFALIDSGGSATLTHSTTLGAVTSTLDATVSAGVVLSHAATLGPVTQSFSATLAPVTTLTHSATLGAVTGTTSIFSGATITSPPLKRNNGSLVASTGLTWVSILDGGTGALLGTKTGVSTDAAGRFAVRDDGMTPGSTYQLAWLEAGGERGHGWGGAT